MSNDIAVLGMMVDSCQAPAAATALDKFAEAAKPATARAALETSVLDGIDAIERSGPMRYGKDDCALWVADILRPVLGYDPAAKVRGRYKTRRGSLRLIGARGLLGQMRSIARRHNWKRIAPESAKPGDAGLAWTYVKVGKREVPTLATVICRAPGWFVGRNERGITVLRAKHVAVAWSVLPDSECVYLGNAHIRKIAIRPDMCPTSAVCHEPVSIGLAITSLLGIAGVGSVAAGIVGSFALTALSPGISMQRRILQ